ncbi:MAG: HEAT repeat domain-containing protein [Bacteriovoracaceae bacterium]|nr:HEAT repeat domain-containing protein [Bacteriovoracaceae bacterium]
MKKLILLSLIITFSLPTFSAIKGKDKYSTAPTAIKERLLARYEKDYKNKIDLKKLKADTLALNGKAVPALIQVMKSNKYPDKNKWMATFLLGRIMGKKSSSFIAKFSQHPSWIMRMASLKTLLALNEKGYGKVYALALKDKSYIVRVQALENLRQMNLKKYAPYVWQMLYDKKNYHIANKKNGEATPSKTRSHIIKKVVRTVGDLNFKKAQASLLSMVQKKRYDDIFEEMDYALSKLTNKKSPAGNKKVKKNFWKRVRMSKITI